MPFSTKCRRYKDNDSVRMPQRHIFVDCETYNQVIPLAPGLCERSLRLWSASYVEQTDGVISEQFVFHGKSAKQFWQSCYPLFKSRRPVWIWSHNAAQDFTWLDVWGELDGKVLSAKRYILEDCPFIIKARYQGCNLTIVDSLNWFKCSISELGKMIHLDKGEVDFDRCSERELLEYCRRDVEILQESVLCLLRFVRENNLGMFRPTLPMQAFAAWSHWKKPCKVYYPIDLEVKKLERQSYFGGRCEVGFSGHLVSLSGSKDDYVSSASRKRPIILGEQVYYLDYSSFYPSVMCGHRYPTRFSVNLPSYSHRELGNCLRNDCVVARVLLNTKTPYPYRKSKTEVIYPTGRYWTTLCSPELSLALERGEIERIGATQIYESGYIFDDYVNNILKLRLKYQAEENEVFAYICKLLHNSLQAKFGRRGGGWRDDPEAPLRQHWGSYFDFDRNLSTFVRRRAIAGSVQTYKDEGECEHSFPAISAHVTSYGRVKLQKTLDAIPPELAFYWDTDSIHTTEGGYNILREKGFVAPKTIGKLDIKGIYDHVEYVNSKVYVVDGRYVVAGVPRKCETKKEWQIVAEYWDRIGRIIQTTPNGITCSQQVTTELSGMYQRRRVQPNGFTLPIEINEPIDSQSAANES